MPDKREEIQSLILGTSLPSINQHVSGASDDDDEDTPKPAKRGPTPKKIANPQAEADDFLASLELDKLDNSDIE